MPDLIEELGLQSKQLEKVAAQIRASLQSILDKAKELNKISLKFGDYSAGVGEFKKVLQQVVSIQKALGDSTNELSKILINQAKIREANTKASSSEVKSTEQKTKAIKDETTALKENISVIKPSSQLPQATTTSGGISVQRPAVDISAYEKLNQQYKEATVNTKALAASYGIESKEAIAAAEAELILKNRLAEINNLSKTIAIKPPPPPPPPPPIISTTSIANVEAENVALSATGTLVSELEQKEADAANAATAMGSSHYKASEEIKNVGTAITEATGFLDKYVGTLRQNITAQLENNSALLANRAEQKSLNADIAKAGGATTAQVNRIAALKQEELLLKDANQKLSVTVKNQIKEFTSSNGSIDQLRTRVNTLSQAYITLSESEKKSVFGVQLKQQLDIIQPALTKAEAGIGQFQQKVQSSGETLNKVGENLQSVFAALGVVSAAYSVVDFFKTSIEEFNKEEVVITELKNILHNIGQDDAFDRLKAKAHALSDEFKTFKDVEIIKTFQQLITYGKLTEAQINQIIPVILNLQSLKPTRSLEETTGIILKSLEGNNRGLKEFGINIRDAKNTSEAFSLVMRELAPRIDGVAKAFGETTAGQIQKTEVSIEELKEEIGGKLEPVVRGFYSTISGAIDGIPELFKSVVAGVNTLLIPLKQGIQDIYVLATQGVSGLALLATGRKQDADNQHTLALRQQADQYAITFAQNYTNKSLREQADAYNQQSAIFESTKKRVLALVAAKQINTAEGAKELLQLHADKAILVELNKIIANTSAIKNGGVLGLGDPDASFRGTKATIDKTKDLIYEDNKAILEDSIATNKALADDVYNLYTFRSDAAKKSFDLSNQLIDLELAHQKISSVQAVIAFRKSAEDYNAELKKIAADKYKLQQELPIQAPETDEAAYKRQLDAHNKFVNDFRAQVKAGGNAIAIDIANNQSKEEQTLQEQRDAGLISETTFRKKLADVKKKYAIQSLDAVISEAKAEQSVIDPLSAAYAELTKAINAAVAAKKELSKPADSGLEKLAKDLDNASAVVGNLTQALSDLYSIGYNNQKTALQEIGAQQDKNYEREVSNINNSMLAAETKANQLTILDKAHQAQQESNARKQQNLDNKKAKFDRDISIFNIIINTARAVVAALASVPPNVPLSIAVGIAGAAQLAVAIATKIPQLHTGTKSAKEGYAVTDEKGAELYIEPDGKMSIGNDYPTLRYLKAGTEVVRHDMVHEVLYNAMIKNTASSLRQPAKEDKPVSIEKLAEMIVRGYAKNKPIANVNIDIGGQLKFKRWVDKNVRGQA